MTRRIDAHQHFWRIGANDCAWPTHDLAIYRDYLPADLAPLLAAAGIEGSIVVQSQESDRDTDWLCALADPRQAGGADLHKEGAEAPRVARADHDRRAALVSGGNEGAGQRRAAGGRPARQQSSREQPPAATKTRTAMLRFRRMKTHQKFASVHANVHNHFNLERHLIDRQCYRERRSAAYAEWKNLVA